MANPVSLIANSEAPKKKQKTSTSKEEIPLRKLMEFLPIGATLNLFKEYLPQVASIILLKLFPY